MSESHHFRKMKEIPVLKLRSIFGFCQKGVKKSKIVESPDMKIQP